ncbi:MAG: Membrane alanyl aminopeptidase Metallo peptidase family [Marmoricola sp.]|nr:Membrane alanyl aminopeptidase Metallo peptidase family [Marmoricola sp.]
MRSLQLDEALARFDLLTISSYDVTLDLAGDPKTFSSRTAIRLVSRGGTTFLDVKPVALSAISLDGHTLDPDKLEDGRYPLDLSDGEHEVVVDAVMPFRNDGEGLHRSQDPADGRDYVYGMSFLDAAPTIFACFDQTDLKAPYTFHVTAPSDWLVFGNAAGTKVSDQHWEFEQSQPLSTYFVTIVAGPYHLLTDQHDGIPLGLSARQSLARDLDADADELFTMTKQCFDEFHRLFEVRYPFGKYHQAFVPEFNAGAMENPGCVTFRDPLVFSSKVTRADRIKRATTIAHEMAHQWFGNIVTPKWWDDLWLNESFAEYMGNRVAASATQYDEALVWAAITRKNWGLTADSRPTTHPVAGTGAVDAVAALQDFDGISYAKGSAVLGQLATRLGDDVFFAGVRDHFARHRFGNATMGDLFTSWESAGAGDLDEWTSSWLRTPGLDQLAVDRTTNELVRTPPAGQRVDRSHSLEIAAWTGSSWSLTPVTTSGDRTPVTVGAAPAVIDGRNQAWANLSFDEVTSSALPALMPSMADARMRSTVWNTTRNAIYQGTLDPRTAVDLLCSGLPIEDQDAAIASLGVWSTSTLLSVVADPDTSRTRLHDAFLSRFGSAPAGSGVQLAALQGAVATATDVDWLRARLADAPDRELRWRLLKRLTTLGQTDRTELDAALASEPSAQSRNDHAYCTAAIADEDAKAWAWQRFTGIEDASNYELEATGLGMWQGGQEDLLAPYVDRYFADVAGTAKVRSGWVLASTTGFFYPFIALADSTVAATEAVCADPELNLSLRRQLLDCGDEMLHRLATRRKYA